MNDKQAHDLAWTLVKDMTMTIYAMARSSDDGEHLRLSRKFNDREVEQMQRECKRAILAATKA